MADPTFRLYTGVASGSKVAVDVAPKSGKVTGKAKLIQADTVVTWDPLTDTSAKGALRAGKHYIVSVRLAFLAAETAELVIRVERDGETHSKPWKWTIAGKKKDVQLRGGLIRVAKAAPGGAGGGA